MHLLNILNTAFSNALTFDLSGGNEGIVIPTNLVRGPLSLRMVQTSLMTTRFHQLTPRTQQHALRNVLHYHFHNIKKNPTLWGDFILIWRKRRDSNP